MEGFAALEFGYVDYKCGIVEKCLQGRDGVGADLIQFDIAVSPVRHIFNVENGMREQKMDRTSGCSLRTGSRKVVPPLLMVLMKTFYDTG